MSTEKIDWLQPANLQVLERLELAEILDRAEPDNRFQDAWFVIYVQEAGAVWRIGVRAWQPDFHFQSESFQTIVSDIPDVPLAVLKACHSQFCPVAKVDDVNGKTASVILQGVQLVVPDDTFALHVRAKIFTPVLAHRNRERRIERTQFIPWTYLSVVDASQLRWSCEILSGLKSPIGGKQRGRVETMAIAVRTSHPSSRLELVTQGKLSLPLVAHRIELRDSPDIPRQDEVAASAEHMLDVLLTNRRGVVSIPARAKTPVVWLFAYSGSHLLARVPFVPGCTPQIRLEVPDDAARLEAESDLQILRGQLIESVAARNTAFARIRAKIKKNDLSKDAAEEKEIQNLASVKTYLDRLIAVRVPAVKSAKARKDRSSETRINRMCDEMAELIRHYLNDDKKQQLLEELKEHRNENTSIQADAAEKDDEPKKKAE